MVNADMTHAYIHRTVLYPTLTGPTRLNTVGLGVCPSIFLGDAIYSTTTPWQTRGGYKRSDRHTTQRGSAICVQGFDDSRKSAIHITYRSSLRPSSLRLPRHPWFAIVKVFCFKTITHTNSVRPPFGFTLSGCFSC